jgi:hypothetical protein
MGLRMEQYKVGIRKKDRTGDIQFFCLFETWVSFNCSVHFSSSIK